MLWVLNRDVRGKINKPQMRASGREGVAVNERDGARNGDGQMLALSLKSREGCPVGALPGTCL